MQNLLEILSFTLRNFTKLPILRYYLGFCNVLHIWHIWAIPTYRVYRLYDNILGTLGPVFTGFWGPSYENGDRQCNTLAAMNID